MAVFSRRSEAAEIQRGTERGRAALAVSGAHWGPAEQSCPAPPPVPFDPLISKYETWGVQREKEKKTQKANQNSAMNTLTDGGLTQFASNPPQYTGLCLPNNGDQGGEGSALPYPPFPLWEPDGYSPCKAPLPGAGHAFVLRSREQVWGETRLALWGREGLWSSSLWR